MKKALNTLAIALVLILISSVSAVYAQQSTCVNADFEQNSFAGWVGHTGDNPTGGCCPIVSPNLGLVPGRHTIMTGAGTDPNTGNLLSVVAPGGLYSVRLGNDSTGAQAEQISYTFLVTPQTQMFLYRYAVVLEDFGHPDTVQPRFEIRLFDQTGSIDSACGLYNVSASSGLAGFQDAVNPNNPGSIIRWKDWTTVGIDLSSKLGSTITIEFSTGDCAQGGHFGYAYIDCMCYSFNVTTDFCAGASAATLIAPSGFASYQWNTGETTQSINVINPTIGDTFSVVMTAVTGCQVTLKSIVKQTIVGAAYTQSDSCYNAAFFIDSSYVTQGSPINQWLWNFGDGSTSNVQNPTHSYAAPGTYAVQLIMTNQGGCKDTVNRVITTVAKPNAGFAFTPGCSGTSIAFTDTSSAPNSSLSAWQWNFGDGSPLSSNQSPPHTFNSAGNYTVTLVVEDGNGCRDTAINNYITSPTPVAAFADSVTCANNKVFFKDQSTIATGNITNVSWNFGDGTAAVSGTNPVHSYASQGTYLVILTVTGNAGCTDTVQKLITMLAPPVADFTSVPACVGQPVSFIDVTSPVPTAIDEWKWNFGDGSPVSISQNPFHTYAIDSTVAVSLIVTNTNGCIDTVQKTIFIPALPLPDYTTSTPACMGSLVLFYNSSFVPGGASAYQWRFSDGSTVTTSLNSAHAFSNAMFYQVTLSVTTNAGCIDSLTKNVYIHPIPTPAFAAVNACRNEPVLFNALAGASITGWNWNFGDSSPADTNQNAAHSYVSASTFNVTLTETNYAGCTSSVSHPVTIYALPVANMATTSVCLKETQTFTDVSDSGSAALTNWIWNFGDGSAASNLQNPNHLYADSGLYSAQLVVMNANNCYDTVQRSVYVKPLPEVDFVTSLLCRNNSALFTNQSTLTGGSITNLLWKFGDGDSSGSVQPNHTYTTSGLVNAQLIAVGNNGCRDTLNKPLFVNPLPVADFTFNNVCVYDSLRIQDLSTLSNGVVSHWQWNLGDGSTDTVQHPRHHYNTPGTYLIQLTATGNTGCKYDSTQPLIVFPKPQSDFTVGAACENNLVAFTNHSTVATGTLAQWIWNMGDGSALINQQNPNYAFNNDSIFTVLMIVVTDSGCRDTSQQTVTIRPLPIPLFTADTVCFGVPTSFINGSTVATGLIQYYNWSFENNASSITTNPTHTFNTHGVFPVQLTAVTNYGCMDSVLNNARVYALPQPDFVADKTEGCQPLLVSFSNLSTSLDGVINHWHWDLGDGNSSNDSITDNLYLTPGVFDVSLNVTTDLNCSDSILKPDYITVHPKPKADFTYSPEHPNQLFPLVQITDQSVNADYWLYSFGDMDSSTDAYPTHAYAAPGFYEVYQLVTTTFGCTDTTYRIIEVENVFTLYIPNAFTPNNDGKNDFFNPIGVGITGLKMTVFNRWGQPVFVSNSMEQPWDGTHNGDLVPQGVYFYHAKIIDIFDKPHTVDGKVNVVY